jgi:hypothetical protein
VWLPAVDTENFLHPAEQNGPFLIAAPLGPRIGFFFRNVLPGSMQGHYSAPPAKESFEAWGRVRDVNAN